MKNNPLVSILIPTFNRADYLKFALDSACSQSYPNIEIIVHDDASTDATPTLLKAYKADPRVKVVRTNKNHGMLGGWNFIQKLAKGKYIKFLASDDLLDPDCVQELVKAAEANPKAAIITCQRQFINEQGQVIKKMGFAHKNQVIPGITHAHWILTTVRENKIGEPTAVLYPTRLIKSAGDYDATFSQFADFEYWIRLLAYGDLVYVHKPLCSFRLHSGSSTSAAQRDGRFITEIFALIKKYYDNADYCRVFGLTQADRTKVITQKTLDTLKNIKDLFVHGQLTRARTYFARLNNEESLDHMTKATISFLLKTS